jgi:threonine/homoserine/homoserine lactone efflux protein
MTLSLLGVGALLAASADLFTALKWIGAVYLIWLGVRLWHAPVGVAAEENVAPRSSRAMFLHAYVVTALNPKSIAFFVAFAPQFISPQLAYWPQAAILIATFVAMAALNALAYGMLAARARHVIRRPQVQRWVNRIGGSVLVGAGVVTATLRR